MLLSRFLQSTGPVTLPDVCRRFGWTERAARSAMNGLLREDKVATGDFLPDKPSPQFCWQANLEALHRETLKRLKSEIQPLTLAEYQDFLLRWQHVHPSTRLHGREGLLRVIRQLEGYGTYPLLWNRDILATRVDGFDPIWLRELIEDGTLVFGRFCLMGDPNFSPGGGTVFCEPASLAHLLVGHEPPDYGWKDHWAADLRRLFRDCLTVYRAIVKAGGASLDEITASTGMKADRAEKVLWQLCCGGSITNTSPTCRLSSTCISFMVSQPFARHGLRADRGRWVSCAAVRSKVTPQPPAEAEAEQLRRRVLHALRMYGIASVPVLIHHFTGVFGQKSGHSKRLDAAPIRRACEELVARGDAVKGFLVRGLPGDQYALPRAAEQARSGSGKGEGPMVMISSLDPASLYISIVPVPAVNAYCFPGRFVVVAKGRLAAVIDQKSGPRRRFVVSNVHLPESMEPEDVCRLIDAVTGFVGRAGSFDILDVRSIENQPAARHPTAAIFLHRGFEVNGTRLWIPLDTVRSWDSASLPRIEAAAESGEDVGPIAAIQAVLEQVAGVPITRQRNQGRTVLKWKGKLLVNCPDGKEPMLSSVAVRQDQRDLFAAIPEAFKRHACRHQDRWGSSVQVRLPPGTDFDGPEFRRLARVWIDHLKQRLRKTARRRTKGKRREEGE